MLQNVKTAHGKSWPASVLPEKNFGHRFEKQNDHHSRLFENQDAQNFEILQLTSSNLHKRYMARKASLIVTWPSFKNKMVAISHV